MLHGMGAEFACVQTVEQPQGSAEVIDVETQKAHTSTKSWSALQACHNVEWLENILQF